MMMALLMVVTVSAPVPAFAEPPQRMTNDRPAAVRPSSIDVFVAQAAARFRIPERWIRVVMQAESAGNRRAVSRAGAIGLMQIKPATWSELRARYRLGDDPFDPRDNILAGAAYIRAMYDRFGAPRFLAAYDAGPERYAQHLATGRPLPRETRAYLASLARLIDANGATWLDRLQLAKDRVPLSGNRFGAEVRDALERRADHLVAQGLATRQGPRVTFARDLLATLRKRELDAAVTKLAAETGLPRRITSEGEAVAGTYRQRLDLASGRFAMIDDGFGFELVPWKPQLEKHLGQTVTGTMAPGGGVDWSLGRRRGLGI